MNRACVSIHLYLPQFFSSVFYSFLSIGLLPLWLNWILYFSCCYSTWDFFLVSLSDNSLLVYKNAIDFWILTLYPTSLPNSLIRASSFLVETIGFSCTLSCHLQIKTVLLPLPNLDTFYLFFLFDHCGENLQYYVE